LRPDLRPGTSDREFYNHLLNLHFIADQSIGDAIVDELWRNGFQICASRTLPNFNRNTDDADIFAYAAQAQCIILALDGDFIKLFKAARKQNQPVAGVIRLPSDLAIQSHDPLLNPALQQLLPTLRAAILAGPVNALKQTALQLLIDRNDRPWSIVDVPYHRILLPLPSGQLLASYPQVPSSGRIAKLKPRILAA
jgi:predicted nuclease of predicted toxin-antitoxin system